MNSKTLVIVTALFILSLLTNLYFITTKSGNKQSTTLNPTFSNTNTSSEITGLPINPKQQNVNSAFLVYSFTGKVTDVAPVGKFFKITLDSPSTNHPDFLTTANTFIYKSNGIEAPVKAAITDVTKGLSVTMTTTYDLNKKTWELSGINIQSELTPIASPTASVKPSP